MKTIPPTKPAMKRRTFLELAATAALGWPAAGVAAAAPDSPRPRLSTSSIHFKDLPLEQACERIATLGFEAVDIWSAYDNCPHLDEAARRLGPDGLKQLLAANRLKLYAFSTYVGGYAKYADLLGRAGGGVAIQGSAAPCPPSELTQKMRGFLEGLKPLAELAEKNNSWLAIENHGAALLDSLDSFKAFVDLNTSARLGVALAPYHLQASKASVEEAIAICGGQLLFFYAWQLQPGTGQLPGHGPADFKPWLRALAKAGYKWYVNPFMHGHLEAQVMSAALAKSRKYLLELGA
jgi:sugar phosphate isomerase/epimerase